MAALSVYALYRARYTHDGIAFLLNRLFFTIGLLLMLCIVPVVVTRSIHPELPDFGRFNIIKLIRKAPVGMLGCFLAGLLIGAFYSIVPVFCHAIGLPVTSVSTVMIVSILGGLVLQWPVGTMSDRFYAVGHKPGTLAGQPVDCFYL